MVPIFFAVIWIWASRSQLPSSDVGATIKTGVFESQRFSFSNNQLMNPSVWKVLPRPISARVLQEASNQHFEAIQFLRSDVILVGCEGPRVMGINLVRSKTWQ